VSGFTLTGANGDVITFDYSTFVLEPNLIGLGVPPTDVRIDQSSRAGGIWRNTRRAVRNIDLPVTVLGASATAVETNLRRLAKLTQDTLGPTTLTALRDDGNLTMELHYTGGAELAYGGETGGPTFARVLLSFQAPNPYWISADTESFSVTTGNTGRGLLPQLTKLRVSSSEAIGVINVNNTSDVAVFPVFEITGPVTDLAITLNGQGFGFNVPIAEGDFVQVDHEDATVTGVGNVNRYSILNPSPKFFSFPPGTSSVLVTGTGANLNTEILCEYNLRFEVVHG
jgi:hypothetical protein